MEYKNLKLDISYEWDKNASIFPTEQFEDKVAIISQPKNIDGYKNLLLNIFYSVQFGIWKPTIELSWAKQFLFYKEKSYSSPLYRYKLNNIVTLPSGYKLLLNLTGFSNGHDNIDYLYSNFQIDAIITKQFLNKRLDASLGVTDIFDTNKNMVKTEIRNTVFKKKEGMDARGIYLQLTYNFNTNEKKYKGKGVSLDEMKRF